MLTLSTEFMKGKILFTAFFCTVFFTFFWSQNLTFRSRLDYQSLHQTDLNDVWGYVDEQNNEYALVGCQKGVSIVNVTNPDNIFEVFWVPGTQSVWRDLKTVGDYAYVTTEAPDGLLIIDLSPLPQSNNLPYTNFFGNPGGTWSTAHNLYADDNGYVYVFGANRGQGGTIIYDVSTTPMNPVEVGSFQNWYTHDGYVRNDTLFQAHISNGFFSICDITNKANPVLLGTKNTPDNFSHNVWPSVDGNFVFTTDEVSGAFLGAYDVTDPANIVEVDRIQSSPGSGVIPHNVHVNGNYLVTSYYRDGVTVHDISRPHNMVEVARYDTSPLSGSGFNGCWGTYPFLPSGTILGSDIERGLFVLTPNYQPACFVEGIVTDQSTTNPIAGVEVTLLSSNGLDQSDISGNYALGVANAGSYNLRFRKLGYADSIVPVTLSNGNVLIKNIALVPATPFQVTVKVVDQQTNQPIPFAKIKLSLPQHTLFESANGFGEKDVTLYYQDEYEITVGIWGHITHCTDTFLNDQTNEITIRLTKGYYDDFTFDFGWQSSGTAATGLFERGKPFGNATTANPNRDADYDCGDHAYVTGNTATFDGDLDDVDDGFTVLQSPSFDLTGYTNPHINFYTWFFNFFGPNPPDDYYRVTLSNGMSTVVILYLTSNPNDFYKWITRTIRVADFLTPTANMVLTVLVSDAVGSPNIVEGGFDYFYVSNTNTAALMEELNFEIDIYPNPANSTLNIRSTGIIGEYGLYHLDGRLIEAGSTDSMHLTLNVELLSEGTYLLKTRSGIQRWVKQ